MRVRSRVERLERVIEARPVPAFTKQDGLAWSRRFRDHDPANETLWAEIRAWGAKWNRDYLGPWRSDDVHGGDIMKSLFHPVMHAANDERWHDGRGFEQAPGFLRRFTEAAYRYQQATGDVYPRPEYDFVQIDNLGNSRAVSFRHCVLFCCDLAEKRLVDPQHPEVLRWQKALAERRQQNALN